MRGVLIAELIVMVIMAFVFVVRYAFIVRGVAGLHFIGVVGALGGFVGMLLVEVFLTRIPPLIWLLALGGIDLLLCSLVVLLFRLHGNGYARRSGYGNGERKVDHGTRTDRGSGDQDR